MLNGCGCGGKTMNLGQFPTVWDEYGAYDTPLTVATEVPVSALPTDTSGDWTTNLTEILAAAAQYDLQRKALEINLTRAQQGLAPIDMTRYAPGVAVGMSAQTQQFATIALLGLGGLVLFGILSKRGRR